MRSTTAAISGSVAATMRMRTTSVYTLGQSLRATSRCRSATASAERSEDLVHPLHAVGEAGGARLQDVRRLDLEDPVVADRAGRVPPGTAADGRLLHFLAAPRREDHLGI